MESLIKLNRTVLNHEVVIERHGLVNCKELEVWLVLSCIIRNLIVPLIQIVFFRDFFSLYIPPDKYVLINFLEF